MFDLTRELIENDIRKIHRLKEAISRADNIICISDNTKNDLFKLLDEKLDRVDVIHLGVSDIFRVKSTAKRPAQKRKLLFVGKRDGYKNFRNFLIAFANSSILKKEFLIEVFGGGEFNTDENDLIRKLGVENFIVKTDGNDMRLAESYRTSTAFIYPSLQEGFGLPIVEAMASGCPVICSNSSSFPEVAGSAAVYFSGHSTDSIQTTLESVLSSESILTELSQKGAERSTFFSWKNAP